LGIAISIAYNASAPENQAKAPPQRQIWRTWVKSFIEEINQVIKKYDQNLRLTRIQKSWLAFCIMAIFLTRTVCWAKYERAVGSHIIVAKNGHFFSE